MELEKGGDLLRAAAQAAGAQRAAQAVHRRPDRRDAPAGDRDLRRHRRLPRSGRRQGLASVLRTLFGGAQSEALLAQWLASDAKDEAIVEKEAIAGAAQADRGAPGPGSARRPRPLRGARARPAAMSSSASSAPTSRASRRRRSAWSQCPPARSRPSASARWRRACAATTPSAYVVLADAVEQDLGLAGAGLDAAHLGVHRHLPLRGAAAARPRRRADRRRSATTRRRHRHRTEPQLLGRPGRAPPGPVGGLPADGGAGAGDRAGPRRPGARWAPTRQVGRRLRQPTAGGIGRRAAAAAGGLGRQDGRRAGDREGPGGHPPRARGAAQSDGRGLRQGARRARPGPCPGRCTRPAIYPDVVQTMGGRDRLLPRRRPALRDGRGPGEAASRAPRTCRSGRPLPRCRRSPRSAWQRCCRGPRPASRWWTQKGKLAGTHRRLGHAGSQRAPEVPQGQGARRRRHHPGQASEHAPVQARQADRRAPRWSWSARRRSTSWARWTATCSPAR